MRTVRTVQTIGWVIVLGVGLGLAFWWLRGRDPVPDVGGAVERTAPPAPGAVRLEGRAEGPAAPTPPREGPPGPPAVRLRDMADGQVLAGFAVRLTGADGVTRSDDRGVLELGTASGFEPVEGDWTRSGYRTSPGSEGPADGIPDAWLHRLLDVEGTVRSADPTRTLDPTTVVLAAGSGGDPEADLAHETAPPFHPEWLGRQPADSTTRLPVDADGRFRGTVPAWRTLTLRVAAPGWRDAFVRVALPGPREAAVRPLDILLEPAERLGVLVVGVDGRPVADADVRVMITRRTGAEYPRVEAWALTPYALTALWDPDVGGAYTLHLGGRTGGDGRLETDLVMDGEVELVIRADGFLPRRLPVPFHREARKGLRIGLDRPEVSRPVTVRAGERTFAGRSVLLSDVTDRVTQDAVSVELSADSTFPSGWMVPGRVYGLAVWEEEGLAATVGYFRFDGQRAIDLEQAAENPAELR